MHPLHEKQTEHRDNRGLRRERHRRYRATTVQANRWPAVSRSQSQFAQSRNALRELYEHNRQWLLSTAGSPLDRHKSVDRAIRFGIVVQPMSTRYLAEIP